MEHKFGKCWPGPGSQGIQLVLRSDSFTPRSIICEIIFLFLTISRLLKFFDQVSFGEGQDICSALHLSKFALHLAPLENIFNKPIKSISVNDNTSVHMCIYAYIHIHSHTNTHEQIYIYTYTYKCIHIYIYM